MLNTPGCVIDLRTGDVRVHRRQDYCTKITAVAPSGGCPIWLEFLNRVRWFRGAACPADRIGLLEQMLRCVTCYREDCTDGKRYKARNSKAMRLIAMTMPIIGP